MATRERQTNIESVNRYVTSLDRRRDRVGKDGAIQHLCRQQDATANKQQNRILFIVCYTIKALTNEGPLEPSVGTSRRNARITKNVKESKCAL